MLTSLEDAHNLRTCSQLTKNACNLQKCLQLTKMLTTCENAHNLRKFSQLAKMLTTENQYYNLQKCSHLSRKGSQNTCTQVCKFSPPLLNTERLQHLLHLGQAFEAIPIANWHDFPWLRRAIPFCYTAILHHPWSWITEQRCGLIVECWDSIPKHVQMIMVYIRQSPTPTSYLDVYYSYNIHYSVYK